MLGDNPNPICTLQCQAGCMCPTGTVLDTTKNVCVSQAKCTCPPTCSRDYCRKNPDKVYLHKVRLLSFYPSYNTVQTCLGNHVQYRSSLRYLGLPHVGGQCQLTLCRACYYSSSWPLITTRLNCPTCSYQVIACANASKDSLKLLAPSSCIITWHYSTTIHLTQCCVIARKCFIRLNWINIMVHAVHTCACIHKTIRIGFAT